VLSCRWLQVYIACVDHKYSPNMIAALLWMERSCSARILQSLPCKFDLVPSGALFWQLEQLVHPSSTASTRSCLVAANLASDLLAQSTGRSIARKLLGP
jgi:hypothetical protein